MTMGKAALVRRVHAEGLTPNLQYCAKIVEATLKAITEGIVSHGGVGITRWGSFRVKTYGPRNLYNPSAGTVVPLTARKLVHFTPSKAMLEEIQ